MHGDPINPVPVHARIIALERRVHILTILVAVLVVLFVVDLLSGGEIEAALEDYRKRPADERRRLVYFSTAALPPDRRDAAEIALRMAIPSLSREVVVERQIPTELVAGLLWRLDTASVNWPTFPALLRESYPYRRDRSKRPLIVRADWFLAYFLDQTISGDAYFELLFGDRKPKTANEFAKLFGAQLTSSFIVSHIEDQSRVSLQRTRQIDAFPTTNRNLYWQTRDFSKLRAADDPLSRLDDSFKHDASELIAPLPKISTRTGDIGLLQAYALANGAGELQNFAPASIVVDSTNTRGVEIRNPVSCLVCHSKGLQEMTTSALRRYIESGAIVAAKGYQLTERIERRHLAKLDGLIADQNRDFATIVNLFTGTTPEETANSLKHVITWYDGEVSLIQAARELRAPTDRMIAKLGQETAQARSLHPRIAQLAHGIPIPRTIWEEQFHVVVRLVHDDRRRESM